MAALAYRQPLARQARPAFDQRQRDLFRQDLMAQDAEVNTRAKAACELPMRGTAGTGERRFTAWRRPLGRRYVASIFALGDDHALGFTDAVLLAVSADRRILAARDSAPSASRPHSPAGSNRSRLPGPARSTFICWPRTASAAAPPCST